MLCCAVLCCVGTVGSGCDSDVMEDPDFVPVGPEFSDGLLPPSPLVGYLLLRLLHFYGFEFNAEVSGASVRLGGWFGIDRRLAIFVDPVVIPDPVDESNNVGRSCFRFQQIQSVLAQAYRALLSQSSGGGVVLKTLFPKWAAGCVVSS